MIKSTVFRSVSLAAIASASVFATSGAAHAAFLVTAEGISVEGVETTDAAVAAPQKGTDPIDNVDAQDSSDGLTEIIVTATKRETNLQETPISISVMGADDIKKRSVQSLLDLGDGSVPSLRVATY